MENLDHWRLCDELSVIQSALLIVGVDPASFQDSIVSSSSNDRPKGYDAAMAALSHAILAKRLPATIRRLAWEKGWNEDDHETDETVQRDQRGIWVIYKGTPDWGMTGSWSFAIQTFFHWATLDSSELSRISMAKLTRLNN